MGIMRRAIDLLFPRGPLWRFTGDGVLLIDGMAIAIDAVKEKIDQARAESMPSTAFDTLPEWHRTLGIAYDPTLPLERQRLMLDAILTADGTATRDGLAYQIAKEYDGLEVIEPVSSDGLAAYFSFDSFTGSSSLAEATPIPDDSGSGNTGLAYGGPTPVPGISGKALAFDGVNDYVKTDSVIMMPDIFDMSMWIKSTNRPTDLQIFFGAGLAGAGRLSLYRNTNSTNLVIITYGPGLNSTVVSELFLENVLFYFRISINWATSEYSVFRDGLQFSSGILGNGTDMITKPGAFSWYFGNQQALAPNQSFAGTIDEPRIYNRVLTEAEIKYLYDNPGVPIPSDATVIYYEDDAVLSTATASLEFTERYSGL